MLNRLVACLCLLWLLSPSLASGAAGPGAAGDHPGDHPLPGPAVPDPSRLAPQLPASTPISAGVLAAAGEQAPAPPFLTLPYLGQHYVTSIFDHCNPTYVSDGQVCRFDGTTALASSGVDPGFPRGYAVTPGGQDYLYYDGHNGWDIGLRYEPVLAAADGTVGEAGWDTPGCPTCGYGMTVVVDHPNGFSTRYGHLSSLEVAVGQAVARGQRLGVSGSTGACTGPHLHFGVYLTSSWTAVDPFGWTGSRPDPWPSDRGDLWLGGTPLFPVPGAPADVFAASADHSAAVRWQ